jgi:hypothetical protein
MPQDRCTQALWRHPHTSRLSRRRPGVSKTERARVRRMRELIGCHRCGRTGARSALRRLSAPSILPNTGRHGLRRALVLHYMSAESLLPWFAPGSGVAMGTFDHRVAHLVAGEDPHTYKGTRRPNASPRSTRGRWRLFAVNRAVRAGLPGRSSRLPNCYRTSTVSACATARHRPR